MTKTFREHPQRVIPDTYDQQQENDKDRDNDKYKDKDKDNDKYN